MISIKQKGNFNKVSKYLVSLDHAVKNVNFDKYGKRGVEALNYTTPKDTGKTALSWTYTIKKSKSNVTIEFHNTNIQNGVPIAILLQYGHATKNGSYIQGVDYINPAIKPIFEEMATEAWKEVTTI